ncbi:UNVERIFIED_CONTAM: hypothetical protein FKN15_012315 [Acipenser sinensis]
MRPAFSLSAWICSTASCRARGSRLDGLNVVLHQLKEDQQAVPRFHGSLGGYDGGSTPGEVKVSGILRSLSQGDPPGPNMSFEVLTL